MDRFWSKVDVRGADECWPWKEHCTDRGYGVFWLDGKNRRANRVALSFTSPPDDDALLALHSCDNPSCCNPSHLRWGTSQDNSDDAVLRKRTARGEQAGMCVINDAIASRILKMRVAGMKVDEISEELSVPRTLVMNVYTGRAWSHLHGVDGNPSLSELKASRPKKRAPAYNRVLTDSMVDRIFQGRMEGMTALALSQELAIAEGTVSPVFSGLAFSDRLGRFGNPTREELLSSKSNTQTRLTQDDISEIMDLLARGYTGSSIAEKYGVGKATISRVKNGTYAPSSRL